MATTQAPAVKLVPHGKEFALLIDPQLLREAEKGKMDVDPTSGEELEALVKKTLDQPKEVLTRVKKMLEN